MANPQLKNGFTQLANEILEVLARTNLSGQEFRIILAIVRKTYGFKKKSDFISISQFKKLTGINSTARVSQLTNSLEKKNMLVINRTSGGTKKYMINKDYTEWQGLSDQDINTLRNMKGSTLEKLKHPFKNSLNTKQNIQKKNREYLKKIYTIDDIANLKVKPDQIKKYFYSIGDNKYKPTQDGKQLIKRAKNGK